jgi:hypothetical protein
MTRARSVVTVVAAAALVAGVLWVRDGTAAGDADLAGPPPPSSPAPSEPVADSGVLLLEPNGIDGLRLGSSGQGLQSVAETPGGCAASWMPSPGGSGGSATWDINAWTVDGEVVSITLGTWSEPHAAVADVATWLGPTLGSPIEAAAELPGARTERTRAAPGSAPVTVVTVPGRGVEVVYSDLVGWAPPGSPETGGRVTTVELRYPAGRACDAADIPQVYGAPSGDLGPALDLDGIDGARFGDDVGEAVASGRLSPEGSPGSATADGQRCEAFVTAAEPWPRVLALDDRVVQVNVWSPDLRTSFGVQGGAGLDELRAALPGLEVGYGVEADGGDVTVDVDGTRVRVTLWPATVFVPDVDRPTQAGPPVVHSVVVTAPGVEDAEQPC